MLMAKGLPPTPSDHHGVGKKIGGIVSVNINWSADSQPC